MVHHQPDQQSDSQLIADDEHSSRYQMFSSLVAYWFLLSMYLVYAVIASMFFLFIHMNDQGPWEWNGWYDDAGSMWSFGSHGYCCVDTWEHEGAVLKEYMCFDTLWKWMKMI